MFSFVLAYICSIGAGGSYLPLYVKCCIANLLSAVTAPLGAPAGGAEVDSVSLPASLPLLIFLTH